MTLVALLVAAGFAQPASADDRSTATGARQASAWSGTYVGAFGGWGISSGRATLREASGALIPLDVAYGLFPLSIQKNATGGLFGVGIGYNVRSGPLVGGVEADIGHVGTSARHDYSRIDNVPGSPFPGVSTNTSYATDFGTLGTLRLRAGYVFGDTLIFGTAGLAAGNVRNRVELSMPGIGYTSPDWSGSGMRLGYVVGIGVEHRVARDVSVKLETLYVNLADRTVRGTDPGAFPGETISYRFANDLRIWRIGVNAKF